VLSAPSHESSEPGRITLVVISDVRLYREGVAAALARRDGIAVVGSAANCAADGLAEVSALRPDVVIVDMAMRDSLAGIRALATLAPATKIVVFAVDELESQIVPCAEAGVSGYVPCDASIDDLASTVESVVREESPCSPRIAATLFRRIATLSAAAGAGTGAVLSARERQILMLIRGGLSNKEIAQKLAIEVATVKNHVHSVLGKLGVTTRAEAAACAQRVGLRSRTSSGPASG